MTECPSAASDRRQNRAEIELMVEKMLRMIAREYNIVSTVKPKPVFSLGQLVERIRDQVYHKERLAFVRFSREEPGVVYVGRVIGRDLVTASLQWPFSIKEWHQAMESIKPERW